MKAINQTTSQTSSANKVATYADIGAELGCCRTELGIPLEGGYRINISVPFGGRAYTDLTLELGINLTREGKLLMLQGIRDELGSEAAMDLFVGNSIGLIRHWLVNRFQEVEMLTLYQVGRFLASGSVDPVGFTEVVQ